MTEEFESFDQIKEKIKNDFLRYQKSAKTYIPKCVDALKVEQPERTKDEIKDIILKEFLQYWTRKTIMDALGDEYKDKEKQEAGKQSQEGKQKVAAEMISAKNSQQTVTEDENITTTNNDEDNNKENNQNKELEDWYKHKQQDTKNKESGLELEQPEPKQASPREIPQYDVLQLKEQQTQKQLLQEERIKSQNLAKQLEQEKKEHGQLATKLQPFHEIKYIDLGFDEPVPFRILVNPAAYTNRIPSVTPVDEDFLKKIKRKLGH